ncbi:MAG: EthD domain-containing protein [Sphingomonadaceae bacterium]|nr:EthD domain-containing protein [Sphingomonadaceae bacterium]
MRSLCTLVHKPASTREAFQLYYEAQHAPLAATLFPFTNYARNHLLDAPDIGFDTISEFHVADPTAIARLLEGPVGETIRADEAQFMDAPRNRPAAAEQMPLSPGPVAAPDGLRTALLVNGEHMREDALAWARSLAGFSTGVSIDFLTPWSDPAFPAKAVIWLPGEPQIGAVPPMLEVTRLKVRHYETPADQLTAR